VSPRAGLTADRILDLAEQIADEEGYASLTLHGVAAAAGVRPPSLYHHVAGLDAIRQGLHLRGVLARIEAYRAALEGMPERATPGEGGARLRALAHAERALASARPGIYAASQPSVHAPETDPELRAAAEQVLAMLVEAMAALGLAGEDALHAVRVTRSAIHGFIDLERTGAWGMPIEVDESFERLLDTLEVGLGGAGSGA
jgi:AcrR family transcriptional regulator